MGLTLVPTNLTQARAFIGEHHRHSLPPQGGLFAVGTTNETGTLVGVAIAGRPVARALDNGTTIEITRVATNGHHNACSILYGAITRAAKALGYHTAYTYTLATEPGTSLKATGWTHDADLPTRPTWDGGQRHRQQQDLFGNNRRPPQPKTRWTKQLC